MDNGSQGSEQDRARTEEDLAGGPVSRGASNQDASSNQTTHPTASGDNDKHYDKLTNRDLGSVGGGPIPGGNTYGGMNTSSDTPADGESSANTGDASSDPGSTSVPGMSKSPGAPNASDEPGQGTLGGRNPGQTQNQPIGDQDTTFGHRDSTQDQIGDPMTSRAPDKVNQPKKQDE